MTPCTYMYLYKAKILAIEAESPLFKAAEAKSLFF